eukprot:TRINITY_DN3474_c0_g1_i2.p1 TRINITY_DN3474_c0_g1~~TRINITY_DN3474_c0_g1_i2.p1  ORF type:complete len:633 (+),score=194.00 TRINITY_DN3474_c0_g1_i2:30-1901(+)
MLPEAVRPGSGGAAAGQQQQQQRLRQCCSRAGTPDYRHLLTEADLNDVFEAKLMDWDVQSGPQRKEKFVHVLKANSRGQHIVFRSYGLGQNAAALLADKLRHNHRYTALDLSGNSIGDEGAEHIGAMLKLNHTLTSLDLKGNDIGLRGTTALFEALMTNRTLTHLDLAASGSSNRNRIGSKGTAVIADALRVNPVLALLHLKENGLGPAGVAQLATGLDVANVTSLDLSCNNIGPEGCTALAAALCLSTQIVTLMLSQNRIGDAGTATLAKNLLRLGLGCNCLNISYVDLSHNEIGFTGAKKIASSIVKCVRGSKLNTLLLAGNNVDAPGLQRLVSALIGGGPDAPAGPAAAYQQQGTTSLAPPPPLAVLDLSSNELGKAAGDPLMQLLQKAKYLTKLDLTCNNLEAAGVNRLAAALETNTVLTHLDLKSNRIGADGAPALAEGIAKNTTLQYLDISDNGLKQVAGDMIAAAIEKNTSLLKLPLRFNDLSFRAYQVVRQRLHLNRAEFRSAVMTRIQKEIDVLKIDSKKLRSVQGNLEAEQERYTHVGQKLSFVTQTLKQLEEDHAAAKKLFEAQLQEKTRIIQETANQALQTSSDTAKLKSDKELTLRNVTQKLHKVAAVTA